MFEKFEFQMVMIGRKIKLLKSQFWPRKWNRKLSRLESIRLKIIEIRNAEFCQVANDKQICYGLMDNKLIYLFNKNKWHFNLFIMDFLEIHARSLIPTNSVTVFREERTFRLPAS